MVALTKVVIPEEFNRRYVFWLLQSSVFQHPLLEIERSAQNGFNKEDLAEIIPPFAPSNEQRRIVAKLEKLLDKLDSCQKRLAKIPILLKRFRQAVLAAACSGDLTADWREQNLSLTSERRCECSPNHRLNSQSNLVASELVTPSKWIVGNLRSLVTSLDQGWSPKCHVEPSPSSNVWGR